MIQKTKKYDIFKFREDNRQKIDENHVKRLIESIKNRNLLEFRPIMLNSDYEVIDGQHRLLAAKELNIEIFYEIHKDLKSGDIIELNVAKTWQMEDYLNYYVKNGHKEYQNFDAFLKKNNLSINIGLGFLYGKCHKVNWKFKKGEFEFPQEISQSAFEKCWACIEIIKKHNSNPHFLKSYKFWRALIKINEHADFDYVKFIKNLTKMTEKICLKTTWQAYYFTLVEIHNWMSVKKIVLHDEF